MVSVFSKIEPISKKTRVAGLLKEAIVSGSIQSGEQIVEGKIAQQFGVGQGLIREVLIELEHEGFVQRTPFSGTQVSKLGLQDALQIFDIRIEVEPLAFSLAGHKISPQQLKELKDLALTMRQGAKAEELEVFFSQHLAFRKRIWEISGNRYLQQTLERLVIPLFALYGIRRSHNSDATFQTVLDCMQHQEEILETYRTGDIEGARRVARDFLVRMKDYLGRLPPDPVNDSMASATS